MSKKQRLGILDLGEQIIIFGRPRDEAGAVCVEIRTGDHLPEEMTRLTTPEENEAGELIFRLRTKKTDVIDALIHRLREARTELVTGVAQV